MSSVIEKEKTNKPSQIRLLPSLSPKIKPQVLTLPKTWACPASASLSGRLLATLSSALSDSTGAGFSGLGSHHHSFCCFRTTAHAVLCAWNTMPFLGTLRNMPAKSSRHHRLGVGWSGIPITRFQNSANIH